MMEILTPSGFQKFDGIAKWNHDEKCKITFIDGMSIECSMFHKFVYNNNTEVYAQHVKVGDNIGGKLVKVIDYIEVPDIMYDPINVANGSVYYHDDFIPSTQTFFGTGDTLIDVNTLLLLQSEDPLSITRDGVMIYEEPERDHEYIMTVDVAKGRGQDHSTFNLIDITQSPWKQVATYRNNRISPILFPDIIAKYGKVYNEALVVVESNDAGQVVCVGLYHDLEYENMYVESAIKHNALGVNMDRKVKRIGCSAFKDILETGKLHVVDKETISEITTFIAKGQSYEASEGNHDDMVMTLVMLGYFVGTNYFGNQTGINLRQHLFEKSMKEIEADILPFGFIDAGDEYMDSLEEKVPDEWMVEWVGDYERW
jgi:hypothetical protein